jgi:molybdopterin converting factor small subunit
MRQGDLKLRIRLYGRLADAIGPEIDVDPVHTSVGAIRRQLASEHPDAAQALARSRAIIGAVSVTDQQAVDETDALEFLPPVSGG